MCPDNRIILADDDMRSEAVAVLLMLAAMQSRF
jgi:hypothetical protein